MDGKDLKKILAGIGIASLLTGVGVTMPGNANAAGGSGWGASSGAGSAEKKVEKPAGGSGWGAQPAGAVSTEEEKEKAAAEEAEAKEHKEEGAK